MRAVWITKYGGYDVLQVRETPDPELKAGEVKVRVKVAGLNFADTMARQGMYPDAPKAPCVVGYETAGVIEALGDGVKGLSVGQRVIAMPRFGGQADVVCLPAAQVMAIPDAMSFEDAAAISVAYLTAYHMLFHVARVRSGESLLIHAAAGGLGIAVLQLARTLPNMTTFGTASKSKHEALADLGLDYAIDYHTTDYAEEIRRLTEGRGVDVVFDSLGGRDWKKGYKLLRPGGRLVCCGFSNMSSPGSKRNPFRIIREAVKIPFFVPMKLMGDNKTVSGVNMGHMFGEVELLRSEMEAICQLYLEGKVKPRIDSIFPFDKAGEAHRQMEERKNIGRILLVP